MRIRYQFQGGCPLQPLRFAVSYCFTSQLFNDIQWHRYPFQIFRIQSEEKSIKKIVWRQSTILLLMRPQKLCFVKLVELDPLLYMFHDFYSFHICVSNIPGFDFYKPIRRFFQLHVSKMSRLFETQISPFGSVEGFSKCRPECRMIARCTWGRKAACVRRQSIKGVNRKIFRFCRNNPDHRRFIWMTDNSYEFSKIISQIAPQILGFFFRMSSNTAFLHVSQLTQEKRCFILFPSFPHSMNDLPIDIGKLLRSNHALVLASLGLARPCYGTQPDSEPCPRDECAMIAHSTIDVNLATEYAFHPVCHKVAPPNRLCQAWAGSMGASPIRHERRSSTTDS